MQDSLEVGLMVLLWLKEMHVTIVGDIFNLGFFYVDRVVDNVWLLIG